MSKRKVTLIVTACMLLLSLLLLTTASLAWFSISTSPEISGMQVTLYTDRKLLVSATGAEGTFTQSINLSDTFKDLAPLKPISTVDGRHWFIPTYSFGNLNDPKDFRLATEENRNVSIVDKDGNPLTDQAYMDALGKGYYVTCTFWLMTEQEEDCSVTLSAPDLTKNNLENWEKDENHIHGAKYGSYALAAYDKETVTSEDGRETTEVFTIDNNAQTALRVGFLVEQDDMNATERFVVYEPNAELRGIPTDKPTEDSAYVHGYKFNEETYQNNVYIPTYPIGPTTATVDGEEVIVGQKSAITDSNLIVQTAGQWNDARVREDVLNDRAPNSNDISYFGKFVKKTSSLDFTTNGVHDFTNKQVDMDLASESMVVNLQGRDADGTTHPKQITMFVWIEGQDVDCWNDIASGTFVVNLEFAAQPKKQNGES